MDEETLDELCKAKTVNFVFVHLNIVYTLENPLVNH